MGRKRKQLKTGPKQKASGETVYASDMFASEWDDDEPLAYECVSCGHRQAGDFECEMCTGATIPVFE